MDGRGVKAGDERPTRLRALFDKIGALPDDVLTRIERAIAEAIAPCHPHEWRGTVCSDGSCDMTCSRCGERFVMPAHADGRITLARVSEAIRVMPAARRDLDRIGDAIRALPGAPVMGRAIGADR